MIPVKLRLRNFMCYREGVPPLSFEGLHVACLCGDNGNGKSALLDAMTWALWGRARAKTDDELIHLGRTEMEVEFEFALGQDRYRVIRKRSKPKVRGVGKTLLEFQQATPITSSDKSDSRKAEWGFRSITGNSVRQTQREIEKILHMDYDTFINSAFLLQGRADEFTTKEPHKRKEILADILGLSRYDELEKRAKDHARERERVKKDLESDIKDIDDELAHKGEYEAQLHEVREAIAELEKEAKKQEGRVNTLARQKNELDLKREQREEIEGRIKQAKDTVISFENQVREHHQKVENYEKVLQGYPEELAKTHAWLGKLVKLEEELGGKRDAAQDASNRIHHLTSTNARLKEEMKELKGKLDMLSQEVRAPIHRGTPQGGEARCPLCGTELGVEGRKRIMANYEAQGQEKAEAFRANEQEARRLEPRFIGVRQVIGELERTIREGRAQWERREETLQKDHTEAEVSLPKEREALKRAEEALGRWRSAHEADLKRRESLKAELAILPELEASLSIAQQEFEELMRRADASAQMFGAIQEKLQRCASLEQSRREKSANLENMSKEEGIYGELAAAFGKKGIQALIIETALPEIEEEANRLLARMTDNRMNVKMETQRAYKTKKEEPLETLDINISDELGTRRYEMYSGGEAFKINFALRIALSKLLARRAGAPLPTLIIDEGFGTQDSSGSERLVNAINSIQDDFEKILVVTHIEELKDAFPVRIEVTKTAGGSMIEVS
ncbi:MAG: SMC family ATPase [Dehalococcoidia bacterium]|nr:SMC family ATPase [Dehalococcoidia bacterium]